MRSRIDFHIRVGKKIREIRERLAISPQELAEKSHLSLNTINSIESRNRDIKISELHRVGKALNIRLGGFLNSCDSQVYERKKEESIDGYIPIKKLSKFLNISASHLKMLCRNKEIPFFEINKKYFFKASQINAWLQHYCSSRKRVEESKYEYLKVFGLEPLISTKEAARLLGCSQSEIYKLRRQIPFYVIGRRTKFRISDIENALNKNRIDLWEISTQIGKWQTSFVRAYPTKEEKLAKDESWERRYSDRARPGYVVKTKTFERADFPDLKKEVQEFIDSKINKYNLLGCVYSYNDYKRYFSCELKWWSLPEGRDDYKVHSAGLSSNSPDNLREKVAKFRQMKVQAEDFIGVEYFTWGEYITERCHHARVTYYMPKKQDEGEETRAQTGRH